MIAAQPIPQPDRPARSAGPQTGIQRPDDQTSNFSAMLDKPPPLERGDRLPLPALAPLAPLAPEAMAGSGVFETGLPPDPAFESADETDVPPEEMDAPIPYFSGRDAMLQVFAQLPAANAIRLIPDAQPEAGDPRPALAPVPLDTTLPRKDEQSAGRLALPEGEHLRVAATPAAPPSKAPLLTASLETHHEPAGVQPVYLQIAQRLENALSLTLAAPASSSASPPPPHILPEATKAPVQVLRLQLQPAELGAVEVRLHLRAGDIHVRIAVESADARLQLETGADRLGLALREKGYDVQSVVITQDASAMRQQESQGRGQSESAQRHPPDQEQRGGFHRERSDRREHARDRSDRDRDDRGGFPG